MDAFLPWGDRQPPQKFPQKPFKPRYVMRLRRQAAAKLLSVIVCFILAGCQDLGITPAGIPADTATPPATPTPFQANTPTARPSASPTPAFTATITPSPMPEGCLEPSGRIEVMEIPSNISRYPISFRVYFPPCFDTMPDRRYPVLYMIHGQTFKDDQWDRLGLDEAADALITGGQAPPFMIVMPLERNTFEDVSISPFAGDLIDTLIPWIDENYPTCTDRSCRAIGGLSRGGAWALRLGFKHWELFGAIGLHSTPPFIGDPNQLPYWLREIPEGQLPRIWMDSGTLDWWIKPTREFEALLTHYQVPHEWNNYEGGTHEETYWSAHVHDYLLWYTAGWEEVSESLITN